MDSATAKIQSHVAEVKSQVEKNEVIANDKLKKSKTEERTYKTAENDGEKAKVKFAAFAKEAANQLFQNEFIRHCRYQQDVTIRFGRNFHGRYEGRNEN